MGISNPKSTHDQPESTGACIHNTPCFGVFQWDRLESGTSYRRKLEIRRECPVCGRREVWNGRVWEQRKQNPYHGVDMREFLTGRITG